MEKRKLAGDFMDFFNQFHFCDNIEGEYSPLSLAFVGDAIFELYIRTYILSKGNMPPKTLHEMASSYVKAKSQAKIMHEISEYLNDEELNISKRGRNARSGTIPKNAEVVDYKNATGLECLYGYLYLKGSIERLNQLLDLSIKIMEKDNAK